MTLLMLMGKDLDGGPPIPPGTELRITAEGDDRIISEGDFRIVPEGHPLQKSKNSIASFIERLIARYRI